MERPSVEVDSAERVLDSQEVSALPWTAMARFIASNSDGALMDSEVVTKDRRFGYVYRYDIVKFLADDGSFHPELGSTGTISKVETKLVLHTQDGQSFNLATHPMFELPRETR